MFVYSFTCFNYSCIEISSGNNCFSVPTSSSTSRHCYLPFFSPHNLHIKIPCVDTVPSIQRSKNDPVVDMVWAVRGLNDAKHGKESSLIMVDLLVILVSTDECIFHKSCIFVMNLNKTIFKNYTSDAFCCVTPEKKQAENHSQWTTIDNCLYTRGCVCMPSY